MRERASATPRSGRYFVETFGCQMNVNDSEKVAGLLQAAGYEAASAAADADIVFVNTCAVREKAARKLYSRLGDLRRLPSPPDARRRVLAVGGCVAQLQGREVLDRAPDVDVLVGPRNLARVPELVREAREGRRGVDLERGPDSFAIPDEIVVHSNPVRAYVTVMEGCNHVCSFCVVPRTRGPEVCRPPEAVVRECASLVTRGVPEVMLLGQTVNAYRWGSTSFGDLLARIDAVHGLVRLRFTTSHPENVDAGMIRAFRELSRLSPYLHLPPQSGADRILGAMRRGYSRAGYLETVAALREARPDLALSGDVIVGYPGETESDFVATLDLLDEVGFDGLYSFTYSPRPGTTAWRDADDVEPGEKRRRLRVLNDHQQRLQHERNSRRVGRSEEVLVEAVDPDGRATGRTPHFRIVHFDGPASLVGQVVPVRIESGGANSLQGRWLDSGDSLTTGPPVSIF